jgi:hypothetical protein
VFFCRKLRSGPFSNDCIWYRIGDCLSCAGNRYTVGTCRTLTPGCVISLLLMSSSDGAGEQVERLKNTSQ